MSKKLSRTKNRTNYARGRRFEYTIMRHMEAAGFSVARTTGSHGTFDVIAWDHNGYRMIQCKTGVKPREVELEKFRLLSVPANTTKVLAWRPKGARGAGDIVWKEIK